MSNRSSHYKPDYAASSRSNQSAPKVSVVNRNPSSSTVGSNYSRPRRSIESGRYGTKQAYERFGDHRPSIPREKIDTWTQIQNTLRSQLIANDEFDWSPPYAQSPTAPKLERVAGIDIAVKGDNAIICIAIEQDRDRVLYLKREVVFTEPYRAGFQAFREAPSILAILKEVEVKYPQYYPQLLMIQGNGTWHFRKFGLASHIGVEANIPTVGVAKNLLWIRDQIEEKDMDYYISQLSTPGSSETVRGASDNFLYGAVMKTKSYKMPFLYVSTGHRVSLRTAVELTRYFGGENGLPTPILYADCHSRNAVGARGQFRS